MAKELNVTFNLSNWEWQWYSDSLCANFLWISIWASPFTTKSWLAPVLSLKLLNKSYICSTSINRYTPEWTPSMECIFVETQLQNPCQQLSIYKYYIYIYIYIYYFFTFIRFMNLSLNMLGLADSALRSNSDLDEMGEGKTRKKSKEIRTNNTKYEKQKWFTYSSLKITIEQLDPNI